MKLNVTADSLEEQLKELDAQKKAVEAALRVLTLLREKKDGSLPNGAQFEVRCSDQSSSANKPILVTGYLLTETYKRAVTKWNRTNRKGHVKMLPMTTEVFIITPKYRFALQVADAANLINPHDVFDDAAKALFFYDPRSVEPVGKTVWPIDEKVPGQRI